MERIAEAYSWAFDRTSQAEVTMHVDGSWCGLMLSLNWRDDFEILHAAVSFDMKVPQARRDEATRLLARINEHLLSAISTCGTTTAAWCSATA